MGSVFDPERVGSGNIPADANGQAQYDAAIVLGESLTKLASEQDHQDPDLIAHMVYGSANRYHGAVANRRSDVDLLVVANTFVDTSRIHQGVRGRVRGVELTFDVDVNPIIFNRQELESDARVNPFYADHLAMVRGFITHRSMQHFCWDRMYKGEEKYKDVERALFNRLPFVEAWPFAIEYLKARRTQFQTQLDQVEPNLTKLKGPFELPRNLGRTLVSLYEMYEAVHSQDAYNPETDDFDSPVDPNATHQDNLLAIAGVTDMVGVVGEDLMRLSELDADYTKLLEATVAGDVSVADYERWLRNFYTESLERAFKVVDLADAIVYRTVEKAKLDPHYDTLITMDYDEDDKSPHFLDLVEVRVPANEAGVGQIVPVAYDHERLTFSTTPRFPELDRMHLEHEAYREEMRRLDHEEYLREEAAIAAMKARYKERMRRL